MSEKKSWKNTLNLPRTEFAMKASLPTTEPARLEHWSSLGLEGLIRQRSHGRPRFVLHDGPPYANGRIHIGHALNKILKDLVVKSRTMMGYDSPYVPGWDCHGLPIEHQVDKELGAKKREMTAAEFRRACRDFADRYLDIQRQDFIRLGIHGDWDHPYSTMSYEFEATIAETLGRFFETGAVYKGLKPVHWCTFCQTALAEAEVEYDEKTSPSVFVRFPALPEAAEALGIPGDRPLYAVIWTTTPWTLPANLAIALHPEIDYSVVRADDGYHIVASELAGSVAARFGWDSPETILRFSAASLDGLRYKHAFLDREGTFILGENVTLEAGTGLVHTAPGHGADDYQLGRRYGLPIYTPVDHRGRFTEEVPEWSGLHVFEANPKIVELLEQTDVLLAQETITHSYPHCWRCKNPVIFRATEQWFISMDLTGLRGAALRQIEQVEWLPKWGRERIAGMVANRPDWCISRQRLWGVPITVLYCSGCGEQITGPEFFARVVAAFREAGADAWFEREASSFLPDGWSCPSCQGTEVRKESDILDVWFDSGSSHLAVLKTRDELSWPAALYMEGHDQHRGWFQSSLLIGTGVEGAAPFERVITHGFVVDDKGRKMSKSLGNVVSPQEIIEQHGADILRLWVSMVDYRDDIAISREILLRIVEAYRKIRNTARFLLANLNDFDPSTDAVPDDQLEDLDRWILHRAGETLDRCRQAYESFEFHVVYHRVLDLCTVDLSAIYLDIAKDRLYVEGAESATRRAAQTAIERIVRGLASILAPILAFTADEIYEGLPGDGEVSVHLTSLPSGDLSLPADQREAWGRALALREAVSKVLEKGRAAGTIGHSLEADIQLTGAFDLDRLLGGLSIDLAKLFIVSHVEHVPDSEASDLEPVSFEGIGRIGIVMTPARGAKCGRCWHYREEVSGEGDLCARCEAIVAAFDLA